MKNLQEERKRATFEVQQLTNILYGGEQQNKRRKQIVEQALDDLQTLGVSEYHYLSSRQDKYSDCMRRSVFFMQKLGRGDFADYDESLVYRSQIIPNEPPPVMLHTSMFLSTLESQATPEQLEKWLSDAKKGRILGTYAQTEMGHGTHIRALETQATYDPSTEEFVIHSPTLTATKWWPGGLGKTTNHAVVMAMLYTRGVNQGMHAFLVQTRSMQDHTPLPGITIGDIGPKLGFDTIDNGYLRFDHVRIPRENMLMRYARVDPDGTYTRLTRNPRLSYGTMIFVRAMIAFRTSVALGAACTIAIRYSCVRTQSEITPGAGESVVLDFQTQQQKLLVPLAAAYAYWFAGQTVTQMYREITKQIQAGNEDLLPELHGVSAGLKALTTYATMAGKEQCRLACGGHGYSQASGLPKIYANSVPDCTLEGENTVLYLQTARYLLKNYTAASNGQKLTGSVAYLSEKAAQRSGLNKDMSPTDLVLAYRHRAVRKVNKAAQKLLKLEAGGQPRYQAWNNTAVLWVQAAETHCQYYVIEMFAKKLEQIHNEAVSMVTRQLFQLHACQAMIEHPEDFMLGGYLNPEQLEIIKAGSLSLLAALRPNAVALVDAFDFTDNNLGSVLGRYDGNVYENLYKWAKDSPMNESQVHESFYKYLRPMMKAEQSKL